MLTYPKIEVCLSYQTIHLIQYIRLTLCKKWIIIQNGYEPLKKAELHVVKV
jgi:hypothetical protein